MLLSNWPQKYYNYKIGYKLIMYYIKCFAEPPGSQSGCQTIKMLIITCKLN